MTTPPTDDTLPRDPRFDATWRTTSSEEPPPALDAAILAAAHREAGSKPQSLAAHAAMRARRRWWPLAAAATVAVIAIGVVQRAGHDELVLPPSETSIVSDVPAPTAKSVAEAPQRPAEAPQRPAETPQRARADTARRSETAVAPRPEKKAETAARTASLPEPFPASPPSAPMAEQSVAGNTAERQEAATSVKPAAPSMPPAAPSPPPAAAPPSMPPPAASFADSGRVSAPSAMRSSPLAKTAGAGAAEEARMKDRAPLPVNDWIALIRRLRDEANTVEAARELAAFRTAHPDHEKLLPPDLRDWHPAEK